MITIIYASYRDMEDSNSIDEYGEPLDDGSLASFGSGNTTDSDKVNDLFLLYMFSFIQNSEKSYL